MVASISIIISMWQDLQLYYCNELWRIKEQKITKLEKNYPLKTAD